MMNKYEALTKRIASFADVTMNEIERVCESKTGDLYYKSLVDSIKYTALLSGKAIRAYLVYEFCAASAESDTYTEGCESYAAGVELMHSFSLIHDDLPGMDNADTRRGKPANHIVFGDATALLAGDALALLAINTVVSNKQYTPTQNCEAAMCLSYYAGKDGMIGGQQLDLDGEKAALSPESIDLMNSLKTGSLMAAACEMGCIAGHARPARRISAKGFGFLLGRAFQVQDDILDVTSTEKQLGKPIGADNQKSTYVKRLGLEGAKKLAAELSESAKKCLETFPECESKRNLLLLVDYLLERKN